MSRTQLMTIRIGSVLLCAGLWLVPLLAPPPAAAATTPTLAVLDPDWPIDARTAFRVEATNENRTIASVRWSGTAYGNVASLSDDFVFRVYQDDGGTPGKVISEAEVEARTLSSREGRSLYEADVPVFRLNSGEKVWLEVQKRGRATEQWGLESILEPSTSPHRLLKNVSFGLEDWSAFALLSQSNVPSTESNPIGAAEPGELRVHPNPTSSAVQVDFSLSSSEKVTARVYDVSGREVRTLFEGTLPAGDQSVNWDGTEASGQLVNNGLFFVKLELGGSRSMVRKVVVMKEAQR